jgi:hypothetical protein
MGRFPAQTSCLTLFWAVLDLLTHAKNGLRFSQLGRERLTRTSYADSEKNLRQGGDSR